MAKQKSVSEMRTVLIEIMADLSMHSHVEEQLLYPTLRCLGHPLVDHAIDEHRVVADLCADLETRAIRDPLWVSLSKIRIVTCYLLLRQIEKVCELKKNVLTHAKEEEEQLFPFLRERLTDEVKNFFLPQHHYCDNDLHF